MAARLPRFDTILIILINVISLSPMLACGYTGDDAINSMMPGMLAERNTTSLAFVAEQIHKWASAYGRFYPLAFYYIPFFAHVQSLLAYRVLGMLIVLSNVYLFARLVSRWTGSPRLGKLAAIFLPLLFQFRPYPDPIHSFCFLLQVTFMFLVAALLWLDGFLETGRRRQLVLGTAAYLCAVLTYEVAWPFFALALVAARLRAPARLSSSRPRLVLWSFGGAAVFFLMLSVALRLAFHVPLVQRHPMDGASKYTPTLQAMAYVDAACGAEGTNLSVDLKGTPNPARVVKLPFYKRQ